MTANAATTRIPKPETPVSPAAIAIPITIPQNMAAISFFFISSASPILFGKIKTGLKKVGFTISSTPSK